MISMKCCTSSNHADKFRCEDDAVKRESDLRYEGWRVTLASGVSVFCVSLLVFTLPIFLKPLADEFSWSRQTISVAFGVAATMSALCAPALGYLADRFGPRRIMVPCLTIFAVTFTAL